ncbi:MAG: aspartate-semialdehyde dehydrogenase [Proteobacteria bacterium]|nr:aspartate-semialdehyde dehydrogenase [Pseudomonadota bacterium]MCP4917956.1 aspartate-semialdehyde dehydrogenase [Pseudomonadota bacterium]
MSRIPVAILGATGMVGQRLVQLLLNHPWFEIGALCASERSAGKRYGDACTWRLEGDEPPAWVFDLPVVSTAPEAVPDGIRVALSALPGSTAKTAEPAFRAAGYGVVSNASSFRMDPDVPLIIPEVNPSDLSWLDRQPGTGFILTNPNCCAVPLGIALAPLHEKWPVEAVCISSWQAVSGAGYPGESAWDIVGNVHPHPGDEEEKLTEEPQKILGASFPSSARCVRVGVADGHLMSVQARLAGDPSVEEVLEALRGFTSRAPELPSSPTPLIHVDTRRDRPQPRLDAMRGNGMAVSVGRVEACPVMGIKFYCLAHNTFRGAAGAAILNLELLHATGRLPAA